MRNEPWHFHSDDNLHSQVGPVICEVPTAFSHIVMRGAIDPKGCPSVKGWNEFAHECAYLFKAAPNLLRALEKLIERAEASGLVCDEARTALTEAKGDTPHE